jgi:hypothetical protein
MQKGEKFQHRQGQGSRIANNQPQPVFGFVKGLPFRFDQ